MSFPANVAIIFLKHQMLVSTLKLLFLHVSCFTPQLDVRFTIGTTEASLPLAESWLTFTDQWSAMGSRFPISRSNVHSFDNNKLN